MLADLTKVARTGSDESNADGLQEATIVVYRPKTNNCCISSSAVRMTRLFAE
jgi:hypothetical protein